MSHSSKNAIVCSTDAQVDLLPQDELGGISVNPTSFARFDARMSLAIEDLQNRWAHKAAPAHVFDALRNDRQRR